MTTVTKARSAKPDGYRIAEADMPEFNALKAKVGGPAAVAEFVAKGRARAAKLPDDPDFAAASAAAFAWLEGIPLDQNQAAIDAALAAVLAPQAKAETFTAADIASAQIILAEHGRYAGSTRGVSPYNSVVIANARRIAAGVPSASTPVEPDRTARIAELTKLGRGISSQR